MSQYEIDLRLPVDIWRKAPFMLVGPDIRFLPLGVLVDSIHHGDKQLPRITPLVLSKICSNGLKQDVVFCFIFLYINDRYERVMLMTHPVKIGSVNHEALEALLKEIFRIAGLLECQIVEVELNDLVEGSVAFPTSFSSISHDVEVAEMIKSDLEVFHREGFREWAEVECFEHKVHELERGLDETIRSQDMLHMTQVKVEDYLKLVSRLGGSKIRSFRLPTWDASDSIMLLNFQLFNNSAYVLRSSSRLGFLKSSECGYLCCVQNLLEPLKTLRTPHVLLFQRLLEAYSFDTMKIMDWGISPVDRLPELLFKATEVMKEKNITNIQFANVSSDQLKVKNLLYELGFKLIHRVKLLRREVE
ncbi:hypothetical protein KEJ21_04980 [Candidatus Bathyarchaeota archaeon]|nr:hypothetical protein [Candidatus Bathyarchaeota archaeon]MBS7631600.1 hypothetical protein [Candidatus Bathyarchaeota archaeon]